MCCQIHGVSLSGQSVVFTDTKSHSLKRFSLNGPSLEGTNVVQTVDTVAGNGSSGTEDELLDVARVSHPTGVIAEYGTIFFIDAESKSVRLITKVSALVKHFRILENIYRAFYIHCDILVHAALPSLLKAEQRISNAEGELRQMLQNVKAKFKVSGVIQGPQGTPAEKTVKSITMVKDFLHVSRPNLEKNFPIFSM